MKTPDPFERCFHCEVARLREREFPDLPMDRAINDLLEAVADYIADPERVADREQLIEFAINTMARNHAEILSGLYKSGTKPERAN